MTERSFFEFGSESGDFDQPSPSPWKNRIQDLTDSYDPVESNDESIVEARFDDSPTHGEIIELIENLHAGDSSPFMQRPTTDRPHVVQLPVHYESRYAYPLVVWFHGDGANEKQLSSILPGISDRNHIGLALRGDLTSGDGFGWSTSGEHRDQLVGDVESLVRMMRRQYHIHSERIYLVGYGSGADAALEVILRRPEWFGGAACLCGSFTQFQLPPIRFDELQNKRVLLTTCANNPVSKVRDIVATGRMLYSSGLQIGTRYYAHADTNPSPKMLSDLNQWLMDDVCSVLT